jgi:LPXTG-motif cell wall-anchored protein
MPPQAPQKSNTMTYVLIGLGVLLVGGVTIFLLRRK